MAAHVEGLRARRMGKAHRGFTLLEMMVVVGIIALIVGIGMYNFTGSYITAREVKARADVVMLSGALQRYVMKSQGKYPTTQQGLNALVPNVERFIPKDPWGNEYQYLQPGKRDPKGFDLWSTAGTPDDPSDDIGNWPPPAQG